jgi:TonB family protein
MYRSITFTSLLIAFCLAASGQTANVAPIKWEQYQVPQRRISIDFPKLPVVIAKPNSCAESEKSSYFAYAAEAVYEIIVVAKPKPIANCRVPRKFDEALLVERLGQIRAKGDLAEASGVEDGRQVHRFSSGSQIRIVYADWKQNQWVEVAVVHREDVNTNEQKFLTSLKFDSESGQDIGAGAPTTIGDEGVDIYSEPATVKDLKDRIQVVAKPAAMYTAEARKAMTRGNVTLRVAFLANGTVGDIEVVKGLANGLTENAIEAAKKMVFLPSRSNGNPVTTKLTIQYGFSIY